jgi:Phospholipase A2
MEVETSSRMENSKEIEMTIPGFTATSSLQISSGRYVRVRSGPTINAEALVIAQLQSVGASPTGSVLYDGFPGIPVYGNYCGPGYGSGDPVDAVDYACCVHDHCYHDRGYFDCSCNHNLIESMYSAQANPYVSSYGKAMALVMATFFETLPCVCYIEVCIPNPFDPFGDDLCTDIPVPGIPGLECIVGS